MRSSFLKIWAARMHCSSYFITIWSPEIQRWSLILSSSPLVLPSIEWVTVVSYSNFSLLALVAVCCSFVGSSSPTTGRASWSMVLRVSGSQWFLSCHTEVCWILFSSSFIPVKCLSSWATYYMPMLMTPDYWHLFTSQKTDQLLLSPLRGTWLGFRSGAIIGAWHWILTKLRLSWLVDPGLSTLHMVTFSCLGFHLRWFQPWHSWREVWQQAHLRRPCAWYCLSCLSKNLYF